MMNDANPKFKAAIQPASSQPASSLGATSILSRPTIPAQVVPLQKTQLSNQVAQPPQLKSSSAAPQAKTELSKAESAAKRVRPDAAQVATARIKAKNNTKQVQEGVKNSVKQESRRGAANISAEAHFTPYPLSNSAAAFAQASARLHGKMVDILVSQTDTVFALLRTTMSAGSISEAVKLQGTGVRQAYEKNSTQMKDLSDVVEKAVAEAFEPTRAYWSQFFPR
jgi:phasin family protein